MENITKQDVQINLTEKLENVDLERINQLRTKREIIKKGKEGKLDFDENVWNFLTTNQVYEAFDIVMYLKVSLKNLNDMNTDAYRTNYKKVVLYIDSLPLEHTTLLLYNIIKDDKDPRFVDNVMNILKELHLLDLAKVERLIKNDDFVIQKRGLKILAFDQLFYSKEDVELLKSLSTLIRDKFKERGERSMKKQLLSSKEKEVWTCECGKVNELNTFCNGCEKDINGFNYQEITATKVLQAIEEKISLISEYID